MATIGRGKCPKCGLTLPLYTTANGSSCYDCLPGEQSAESGIRAMADLFFGAPKAVENQTGQLLKLEQQKDEDGDT